MIKYLFTIVISSLCLTASAQSADDSGISAGFFDSSQEKDINFSEFKHISFTEGVYKLLIGFIVN